MAQDDILIRYKVDTTDLDKASVAVADVTAETKQLQTQIKATFSDKSIEQATQDLYEQGDVMGALITKYGSTTTALKAMEKELATMSALGQRNTAQFKELANATAELKDNIGDTRSEIKKMASDTRVFDTMVQGARGITAAFSVATGVTAVFGKESEDLQKAILKVQGAMAALQGVQELANIATEKGGIATKAYGVALQVVDKISKVTGLSMAASWALATGGITILIGVVTSLYWWYVKTNDEAEAYANRENDRNEAMAKYRTESEAKSYEKIKQVNADFDREQERRRKEAILKNQDANLTELALLKEKINESERSLETFNMTKVFLNEKDAKEYKRYLEDRILETKVAYKKIYDAIQTPQVAPTDNLPLMTTVEPLVTDDVVDMNKRNSEQMNKDLKEFAFDKSLKDQDTYKVASEKLYSDMFANIGGLQQSLVNLFSSIYNSQLSESEKNKEDELKSAGDNAEKRKKIEQKYAIEQAKIKRKQAEMERSSTIFGIVLNLANAIQQITTQAAILSSNPATAALAGMAYSQLGIVAASSAIQIASVAAAPLPQIPKFEKGGEVLAGGKKNDGHLFGRSHRDGGILIEAQGGEYIWDIPTVQKHGDIIKAAHENRLDDLILHKYVAPALSNAPQNSSDSYDDVLLRKTIRDTSKESAKMIVRGVSESVKDSLYFQTRYR